MVVAVPPIRRHYGWRPAERIPTSFPCEFSFITRSPRFWGGGWKEDTDLDWIFLRLSLSLLFAVPNRQREEITGYDDE